MTKNTNNQKRLTIIILLAVVLILLAAVMYFLVQNNPSNSTQQNQSQPSSDTTKSDIGSMMSKVRMEMPKAEVDNAIGNPYECTQGQPTDEGTSQSQYSTERCQYGDKTAESHLDVTYMNGKVWGMTAVKNTAQ